MRSVAVGMRLAVVTAPEGGNLDNFTSEADVCQPEPTTDQAAVSEQLPDLIRRRVGRHVKILGFTPQQQITHTAAHQKTLEPGLFEAIQHLQRTGTDTGPGNYVLWPGDDGGLDATGTDIALIIHSN